jgi:hypothetical protein
VERVAAVEACGEFAGGDLSRGRGDGDEDALACAKPDNGDVLLVEAVDVAAWLGGAGADSDGSWRGGCGGA